MTMILQEQLLQRFEKLIDKLIVQHDEITLELPIHHLHEVCLALRNEADFQFEQLIDVCGVDYLDYGYSEWITDKATASGFERAAQRLEKINVLNRQGPRFAVVYHLLSLTHNQRLRLRVFAQEEFPCVPSVTAIWPSADWFERETFDLYGILFDDHPDLRRILTDYGFIGHPFRKDFPLIGEVEVRYDATLGRVVYDPVSIAPRTLVPKIIRQDNRYEHPKREGDK